MRQHLSTALEVVGMSLIIATAALLDWRLGVAVGGAFLVLVGFALGRPGGPE